MLLWPLGTTFVTDRHGDSMRAESVKNGFVIFVHILNRMCVPSLQQKVEYIKEVM